MTKIITKGNEVYYEKGSFYVDKKITPYFEFGENVININDVVKIEKQVKDLTIEEYIEIVNRECMNLSYVVDDDLLYKMCNMLPSMSYEDLDRYIDITDLIKGKENDSE